MALATPASAAAGTRWPRVVGDLYDLGIRISLPLAPPLLQTDLRRSLFVRRMARQLDLDRPATDPPLALLKLELDRADLDPLAWLKLNAPWRARGLIDEIEADARRQGVRLGWGLSDSWRAWRYGRHVWIALSYHAKCRRPVAMMLFHLMHELAHDSRFAGPTKWTAVRKFGVDHVNDLMDDELRVRLREPEFWRRMAQVGLVMDPRDLCPISVRIWSLMAEGVPRSVMRDSLEPTYGYQTPSVTREKYFGVYAYFDADDIRDALMQPARARADAVRRVIEASPAFAEAISHGEYAGYVEQVLDQLGEQVSRRSRHRARRLLKGTGSPDRVSRAAGPLEPTCASLL